MNDGTKVFVGLLLASMLAIGISPAVTADEPPTMPHVFYGEVTVGGRPVSRGAEVTTFVDEDEFTTNVRADGTYTLAVPVDGTADFYLQGFYTGVSRGLESGKVEELDLEGSMMKIEDPVGMTSKETVTIRGEVWEDDAVPDGIFLNVEGEEVSVDENGFFEADAPLSPGVNEISIEVEDAAGNFDSATFEVVRDAEPPEIEITTPEEDRSFGENAVGVEGAVMDDWTPKGDIVVTVDGEDVSVDENGSFEADVELNLGMNEIVVEAVDLVGNTASESVEVVWDVKPPEIDLTTPEEDEGFRDNAVDVEGSVDDDFAPPEEIVLLVNDEEVQVGPDGSFETTVILREGPQTVSVVAEDLVGNRSSVSVSVMVDAESPELTILSPADGYETPEQEVEVVGEVDDDWTAPEDLIVTVEGEEVTVDSDGNFSTVVELEIGTNNISATATDEVGNSTTETVTVERVAPVPWALYGAVIAIIAIFIAIIAIWRREASKGGM